MTQIVGRNGVKRYKVYMSMSSTVRDGVLYDGCVELLVSNRVGIKLNLISIRVYSILTK